MRSALISVGTAVAILLFAELATRIVAPFDEQWRDKQGESVLVEDSVLGYRLAERFSGVSITPEFEARYTIRNGLRRTVGVAADSIRILLLGDSFVFGVGVDDDETFASVFQKRLSEIGCPAEVVNAGVPGYDQRTQLLALRQRVETVQPAHIISVFLPHDLHTNQELSSEALPPQVTGSRLQSHLVQWLQLAFMRSDRIYLALYEARSGDGMMSDSIPAHVREQIEVTQELFWAMQDSAGKIPLTILSIPQQFQVVYEATRSRGLATNVSERVLRGSGIRHIPSLEALTRTYSPETRPYFRHDGHLNEIGHAVVGQLLAEEFDCPL